jgi:hypothetical protein
MKKFIEDLKDRIFGIKCPECSARKLQSGHYVRGWNNWCEQACGDNGNFCYGCGKVSFKRTDAEYLEILPYWCTFNGQSGKALITKI